MIKLKNITKKYPRKTIFENISFDINEGDFVAIVGSSGKGKSTLLNIIGGLEEVDAGSITIKNKLVNSSKIKSILLRDTISYLFQNYALIDNKTVKDNLLLAIKYQKLSKKTKEKKINDALSKVGLAGLENEKIFNLSGGEQQRVALARIMIKDSEIILADEPTGNLDKTNAEAVIKILEELNKSGKTILVVTHDDFVAEYANKKIVL